MGAQLAPVNDINILCNQVFLSVGTFYEKKCHKQGRTIADLVNSQFNLAGSTTTYEKLNGVGKPTHDGSNCGAKATVSFKNPECVDTPAADCPPDTPGCSVDDFLCSPGTKTDVQGNQFTISIDKCAQDKRSFCADDVVCFCDVEYEDLKSPQTRVGFEIQEMLKSMEEKYAQDVAQALIDSIDLYFDGVTDSAAAPITIPILDSTGCPNPKVLANLVQYFRASNRSISDYWGVGGQYWGTLETQRQLFSAPNEQGINLGQALLSNIVYDPTLDSLFGDGRSHLILVPRGVFLPQEWYKYVGAREVLKPDSIATTETFNNVRYDYIFRDDECAENRWTVGLQKYYDFCVPPREAFCNTSGIIHFVLDCGDYDCTNLNEMIAAACQ